MVGADLLAPEAQKVRVHVDKDYDLQRDSQGVWSVTTTPLVPGFNVKRDNVPHTDA